MDRASDDANSRYIVPGLLRGLSLLGLFDKDRPAMRLTDIAQKLELPRATVFRTVYTLEQEGYLVRLKDSNYYSLGPRVLTLGFEYLHSQELVEVARPILDGLRDKTGASTHMALLDGFDALYIYRAASHQRLSSNRHVGSRLPAHVSSIGRAILAELPESIVATKYADFDLRVENYTEPTTFAELTACLKVERERGYIAGSFVSGISSVAVAIRDNEGNVVAGINVSDYESITCMNDIHGKLKDEVLAAASEISRRLGHTSSPNLIRP